jgi:hypothetical protein
MNSELGEDLGHGVRVSPSVGDELIVTSPRHELGWRVAKGETPGTAVVWRDIPFEAVNRSAAGRGDRWVLRRWDEASAMRGVFKLDSESVREIAERAVAEARGRQARRTTLLLLPLLGLAPARLQKRWADTWGFNAERATQISAIFEMLAGALGIIQIAAAAFGGEFFMPLVLALPGPLLFAFGTARLTLVFADGEPVGSPVGLPLLLFTPKPTPQIDRSAPVVRSFDETEEMLELVSPVLRRDWDRDGTLRYRGSHYRLQRTGQEGRSWVYWFGRCAGDDPGDRELRLAPPPETPYVPRHAESEPPSILCTALVSAAVTLGPRSDQEVWGAHLGVHPMWLTVIGASAELVGGVVNLRNDLGPEASLLVLLDFFLVGEGLLRIGSALTGRPVGSVFGWALRPLYRRWLPEETL